LGIEYGWHYGFGLAGIGMLLGLLTFYGAVKRNVFGKVGLEPQNGASLKKWIFPGALLVTPLFSLIIFYNEIEHYMVWGVLVAFIFFIRHISLRVSKIERQRLWVITYFTVLATFFWAIFEQAGSSLVLFAERNVNLVGMNAAQTNSINSAFIMILAIPFSLLWAFLTKKGKNPASPYKMAFGLVFLGIGYLVFALSAQFADNWARVPMFFLIFGTFIYTVGEMFLSPVGLSKVTELSPMKYAAFIMGIWFLSSFYGHFFAGQLAGLTSVEVEQLWMKEGVWGELIHFVTGLSPDGEGAFAQLYQYAGTYAVFAVFTVIIGVIGLLLAPQVKKFMHGVN
jgi:POT family proton-dependent oligopeptide transporter